MHKLLPVFAAALVLAGLYMSSLYNYLLFHTIAEIFSVVIACGIFMVAWNTRSYTRSNYLLFIGIAYLCVGMLDFVHTLSYSGMNIFPGYDSSNTATQLWIASRYLESLTLLIAPFVAHSRIRPQVFMAVYGLVVAAVLFLIFYWPIFPDAFLEEAGGLTPFKIISEYIICLILLASAALFIRRREDFDSRFLTLILMAIGTTILAELAFTTYGSVYGFSNLAGHFFKIASFYLMYKAIIENGLAKPVNMLFSDLHRQKEWLRITLASIGDAVIATDTKGHVNFMNQVAEKLTGWTLNEASGNPLNKVFRIINENSRETVKNPVEEVFKSGKIEELANNTLLIRKDGKEIPIHDSGAPIRDQGGRMLGAVLIFLDISKIREAEKTLQRFNNILEKRVVERTELAESRAKQLQSLAVELVEAEETERRRIAQVLHDDLQQLLAAGRLQLQTACENLPEKSSLLKNVEQILGESIDKSRRLSHELSPPVLHQYGFKKSVQWLVGQMNKRFGLQVEFEENGVQEIKREMIKVFLFRATQELLFNVVKHSGVEKARLNLTGSDESLTITVSDQGKGFNPELLETSSGKSGLGLLSLRDRISSIGGKLVIESAPGRGATFILTVPLGPGRIDEPSGDIQGASQER